MFAISVAAIIIQMITTVDIRLILGETVVLIVGGIVYVSIIVHNGMWKTGSKFGSKFWYDILISVICSGAFSLIFALCLLRKSTNEMQIMKDAFIFFVGITIVGFIFLRVLGAYSRKKIQNIKNKIE